MMRCESGWTGDRCVRQLHHDGPHSNDDPQELIEWALDQTHGDREDALNILRAEVGTSEAMAAIEETLSQPEPERDPIEVYGTEEHEWWLMEMERRGDYQ